MHLSIACPTIPPGAVGEDLTNQKFNAPPLGNSGDQMPSNPLYLEAIRWRFDQTKGQIPHPINAYFIQNQV